MPQDTKLSQAQLLQIAAATYQREIARLMHLLVDREMLIAEMAASIKPEPQEPAAKPTAQKVRDEPAP